MTTVSEPHVLVIESFNEDDGIYDYVVNHPDSCPKEVVSYVGLGSDGQPYEHHTCAVQYELDNIGIDDLTEHGQKRLEPGEYKIEAWSSYDSFSQEYDGGLLFIEEPR